MLDELTAALSGASRLLTDPDVMAGHAVDQADVVAPGAPLAVLLAASTADVSAALAWASARRVPVVPRGAGTGLSGGATAVDGCLVLSTARMTAIRELAPADQLVVAEAGVITADVDRAASEHGLMYPPDPSSFEISTIGGNVATNAGGLRCVKYGVTRDSVLGLEVVLADGRVISTGRRTVKGVTGYDLTSLFVGSEGTLGIITAATLRLRPRPSGAPVTVLGSFASLESAGDAVARVVAAGLQPSLLELVDRATLRAINDWKNLGLEDDAAAVLIAQADGLDAARVAAGLEAEFDGAGASLVVVSADRAEGEELLAVRRLAYPAVERLGRVLVEDVGVPRSRLPEMLAGIERIAAERDVPIFTVAHAGDGNLHPKFVFDPDPDSSDGVPPVVWEAADEVFRLALSLGGTLTGEHGVGSMKQRWLGLELGEDVLGVQRSIKYALDPLGILNPGKAI